MINSADARSGLSVNPGAFFGKGEREGLIGAPSFPEVSSKHHTSRLVALAQTDHIALLKWSMLKYQERIRDYSGTLYRRERIDKKLYPQQKISVKFKERPFSLVMDWQKNAGRIDKLLYVENKKQNNKMIVHPTGFFSWIKSVQRDPRCKDARKSSRGTCDEFGFYRNMGKILRVYEMAARKNELTTRYLGDTLVGERDCIAIERRLPRRACYPSGRLVIAFDKEYLVPTSITSYDWQGKLLSEYIYEDIQFNLGLSANKFTKKSNRL